jgi:hypothetical protein
MNDERPLEMLKMLADHDRAAQAPSDVEMRLRREFRRDRSRRAWRLRALWSGAAVAVALVGTMAVLTLTKREKSPALQQLVVSERKPTNAERQPSRELEPMTATKKVSSRDVRALELTAPVVAFAGGNQAARNTTMLQPAPVLTSAAASAPTPSALGAQETVTDFFPLLDHAPPFERGEILRVNLPASVMQTVGLPVREERLGDRVQADVLVGEEGLPRAIRFVRTDMR